MVTGPGEIRGSVRLAVLIWYMSPHNFPKPGSLWTVSLNATSLPVTEQGFSAERLSGHVQQSKNDGQRWAGIKFSREPGLALTFQKPYLLDGVCHWAAGLWMFVSWKLQAVERCGQVKAPWGLAGLVESWRG